MPHHHRPTTIAILGADTVVENALSLLLGGAGYTTKVLEEPSASAPEAEEQLEGVDLLLTPSLREETQEGFLKAIEATPAASGVPVLVLSTAPQREPNDRTAGVVPWPTPLEDLTRAIEAALVSAPSSEPGGVERPPSKPAGHGGAAARKEYA